MRWYVNRNGETVGPVEEAQVREWVQSGMRGAMVRDEAGGQWVRLEQSPFAGIVTKSRRESRLLRVVLALALLAIAWFIWSQFLALDRETGGATLPGSVRFLG